jgi:hypothetical protein
MYRLIFFTSRFRGLLLITDYSLETDPPKKVVNVN